MKRFSFLLIGILLVAPQIASASDAVATCKAMYPLPTRNINFVEESTGHDPRQFLIRRCITNERKKLSEARRVQRDQIRETARYNRSSARLKQLQDRRDKGLMRDLQQQQSKRERLRVAPHRLGRSEFVKQRASRRAIVREAEGFDRINAIRRRLRQKPLPDPCDSVGVIGKSNNPCK